MLKLDPKLVTWIESGAILAGSYVGARLVSWLFGKVLARLTRRTKSTLDDRLVVALERPIAYALLLIGAYVAVEHLPLEAKVLRRLEEALVIWAILLATVATVRAYGILVGWFATESRAAQAGGLASEFGLLLGKLGKTFIVLVGLIALLHQAGINVASLVVSLGVGSLAVGLAAQDTLANMVAGFTLMIDRPFKIGERIQLASGEVGDVEAIGMRATRIRTGDETMLVVPNAVLVKDRVTNLSRPTRAMTTRLEIVITHGNDVGLARRLLIESAMASARVDPNRPPSALITNLGSSGVQLTLIFWVRDYLEQGLAKDEVCESALDRLSEAGIDLAVPVQRVVHESKA